MYAVYTAQLKYTYKINHLLDRKVAKVLLDGLILHLIFITGFKYVGIPVVCHMHKVSNKGY